MVPEIRSETYFFVTLCHLLPFCTSNDPENQNFEKKEKTAQRYYLFTYVYHKRRSYGVCFLKYKVQQI